MKIVIYKRGSFWQVGKGNVHSALSLVTYNPTLQKAMEFVFGNVLICKDMDTAKKVAFDPSVMKKCVTLEGESFDPAGTLTGGGYTVLSHARTGLSLVNFYATSDYCKARQCPNRAR